MDDDWLVSWQRRRDHAHDKPSAVLPLQAIFERADQKPPQYGGIP
jgi:hypothetical protein